MGKIRHPLFFMLIVGAHMHAQPLTLPQFLKSTLDDPYYKSFDLGVDYLSNKSHNMMPWLDKLQLLYQDNTFNNYQNRYVFRVYPGNPLAIHRNSQYFQGLKTLKMLEQKMVLKDILRARYNLTVDYWEAKQISTQVSQQKEIVRKINEAYKRKAGSIDFDAEKFMESQLAVVEQEAKLHKTLLERDITAGKIQEEAGATEINFSFDGFITVDRINQFIQGEYNALEAAEYAYYKQQALVSQQKVKSERANFGLGYIQYNYNSDRRVLGESNTGLAFGVTVPLFNNNRDVISREKLRGFEHQGEAERFLSQEKVKKINSLTYLKVHLNHYQQLDSLITSLQQSQLNVISGIANNFDPIIELKYQEKLVEFEMLRTKIKKEIYLQFIAFLNNTDKLQERPLVNYLSDAMEGLEN